MAYKIIKSEPIYKGKIVELKIDTITLPNGKEALREIDVLGEAAAVMPIDADGNVVFVRQYRHPVALSPYASKLKARERKGMALEIPAGIVDDGEDPLVCAARELEEETGFKSDNITHLFSMYPSIGFCTQVVHIYKAENLYQGKQSLDPEEFIEVEKYSFEKSVEMVFNGEIIDGKSIAAIMAHWGIIK